MISSTLTPIALLGFSVALGQERFNLRQLGAIGLGVLGVCTLFGPAALAGTLNVWEVIGAGGVTVGCLCYTLGSVMTRPMMRTLAPGAACGADGPDRRAGPCWGPRWRSSPGALAAMRFNWGWDAFLAWLYFAGAGIADLDDDVFPAGARLGGEPAGVVCFHLAGDRGVRGVLAVRGEAGLGRCGGDDPDAGRRRAGLEACSGGRGGQFGAGWVRWCSALTGQPRPIVRVVTVAAGFHSLLARMRLAGLGRFSVGMDGLLRVLLARPFGDRRQSRRRRDLRLRAIHASPSRRESIASEAAISVRWVNGRPPPSP